MTKKQNNEIEVGVIHHIHHNQYDDLLDEYKRELTISGAMATINISSNDPNENINFLSEKAIDLFCKIKEMDRNEI